MPEPTVADLVPASTEIETPPVTIQPWEEPIGDRFTKAMKKEQGEPEPEKPTKAPKKAKEAPVETKADKTKAEPEKPATKPSSALEAALAEQKPEETTAQAVVEDPLKDYPEDAKDKNWKGLRGVAKTALDQVTTLKADLAKAAQPDPKQTEEVARLRAELAEQGKKLAEYNDAIVATNIELHPDFRRDFIDGRNELVAQASAKLKAYGGDPEALAEALSLPEGKTRDRAIEALMPEDMTETAKNKVLRAVADVEVLDEKRAKAMKAPQQTYETLTRKQTEERTRAAEESERIKTAEFERIAGDLPKKSPLLGTVDPSIEGGQNWNTEVKQAREDAFKLFGADAQFSDMVETAIKGKRFDGVAKMLTDTRTELAAAKAQLAEFDTAQPDLKGGKPPVKSDKEAKLEQSPGDIYKKTMQQIEGGGID